jgi:Acetyltransferase (GNAT) family
MIGVVKPTFADCLHVRRITRADWEWIRAWFGDEELNRRLGPLDEEWLEHVLSESDGVQLVVNVTDGTPVALAGCAWDPAGSAHAITDLAVCPWMRRSGIGRQALVSVVTWDGHPPTEGWVAFVDPDNHAAFEFFSASEWRRGGLDDGMHRFGLQV